MLARDIEFLWDEGYGMTPATSLPLQQTLFNYASAVDFTGGLNPLVQDANGLQAVWNYFRREGADWNAVDPRDVTSLKIGNRAIQNSDDRPLGAYPDSDRCHVDAYLLTPQTISRSSLILL